MCTTVFGRFLFLHRINDVVHFDQNSNGIVHFIVINSGLCDLLSEILNFIQSLPVYYRLGTDTSACNANTWHCTFVIPFLH